MVPPIKLMAAGVRNEAAYRIICRNTRLPDSVAADIDSEIAACRMGAERIAGLFQRFGAETMEACFVAILHRCRDNFRREIFPKIQNGVYQWEDYVEHDGVSEPRLHRLKLTMTKTDDKIILDFRGTDPQSAGPINWPADYAEGRFLIKWVAPVLRSLADSPERAAELHVNEGICDLFEVIFPDKGSLISPEFPAATNARSFVLLRSMGLLAGAVAHAVEGARMPADQETIRYWGLYGHDQDGRFFLWREVLGGGSGGRFYEDGSDVIHIVPDSRNQPAEFAETRFPVLIEKLGLRCDSGGVGKRRGGLGYEKDVRLLCDARLILTADRVHLGCYGVNAGKAGQPYQTKINPPPGDDSAVASLPGLIDGEPLKAGDLVRIITTGGGGWGDPLEREPERVLMDVVRGVVSRRAAEREYGVVFTGGEASGPLVPLMPLMPLIIDEAGTRERRNAMRAERRAALPLIDRGPGYEALRTRTEAYWNQVRAQGTAASRAKASGS